MSDKDGKMTDQELVILSRLNSEEAKMELIDRCQDIIMYRVSKYKRMCFNQVELDDLISECYIAVLEAIEKYDETRGASFATFSKFFIGRRLFDFVEKRIKSVKVVHMDEKYLNRIRSPKTMRDAISDMGLNPKDGRDFDIITMIIQGYTQEEVGKKFNLSRTQIRNILRESIK